MYDRALYYFRKAEKIYSKKDSRGDLSFSYDGMSSVYKALAVVNNDSTLLDTALFYVYKSRDIAKAQENMSAEAYALTNISMIYHNQYKYDKAAETYLEALKLARLLKDERLELAILANLAGNEVQRNRPDSAVKYIEKFVPLQEKLNYKQNTEGLSKIFAEYYYQKKDFKKAYEYIKIYDRYKDSTYNLETTAQINEMQTKFETEKKEKENVLLQSENKTYRATRNYLIIILSIALLGIIGAFIAYKKIKNSKELLSVQKHLVEEKQKEILDSINYAKRIQFALLASDNLLQNHLPDHFVLFRPKDVVSGDFYWATPVTDGFIFVTADCTGHGVPGAFMSLLNISKLSQVINENKVVRPDHILNNVRSEIIKALNPEGSREVSKDGMDAVVCKLSSDRSKLEFSAANNSFYIIRNKELIICKADKMPVGKGHDDDASFTYNEVSLHKGDTIYTLTDGFADQFGGSLGKKFKYRQLEEFLIAIHEESMYIQKQKLNDAFETWKGDLEQVDDVCIIGIKI
jgi:serine phosphatase RsbU (regulator of sigma subunit)